MVTKLRSVRNGTRIWPPPMAVEITKRKRPFTLHFRADAAIADRKGHKAAIHRRTVNESQATSLQALQRQAP
jgi:hypothetical protein